MLAFSNKYNFARTFIYNIGDGGVICHFVL